MFDLVPSSGRLPVVVNSGGVQPEAIRLGRRIDPSIGLAERLTDDGERSVMLFGPNGSGKGTRILTPTLLQMHGARSVVVVDPKGELAALTAPWRSTVSKVVILNPFGVLVDLPGYGDLVSDGYNPLRALDHTSEDFNSDVALLAEAMVPVTGKDPYWDLSARSLIAALIMFTVLEAKGQVPRFLVDHPTTDKPSTVPTIRRVRELLCQSSDAGGAAPPVGLPLLAECMMKSGYPELRNKAAQFTSWERDVQSVVRTAMQHTECFDDHAMAVEVAKGDFDFRRLKQEPTTVYVILPPRQISRHSKWLRLVVTEALRASLSARKAGGPSVLLMLDEFFALGHLQIVADTLALVRGYGVQLMCVLQDINQLKTLYSDLWESFISNAGTVVSFATNDMTTATWLSNRCGETTRHIETKSSSVSTTFGGSVGDSTAKTGQGGSTSKGTSFSVTTVKNTNGSYVKVPLITPHKLMGLPPGFMVMLKAGRSNVIPNFAEIYTKIEECRNRVVRKNPYRPD